VRKKEEGRKPVQQASIHRRASCRILRYPQTEGGSQFESSASSSVQTHVTSTRAFSCILKAVFRRHRRPEVNLSWVDTRGRRRGTQHPPTFKMSIRNSHRSSSAIPPRVTRSKKNNKQAVDLIDPSKIVSEINDTITATVKNISVNTEKVNKRLIQELIKAVTNTIEEVLTDHLCRVQSHIDEQAVGLDNLEQYTRRNSIRIFGVPEVKTNGNTRENTDETVIKIIGEKLNVDIKPEEICRSHRITAAKPSQQSHEQPKRPR